MGFIILAGIVIYCLIHSEAIYEASERMRQEAEAENIKQGKTCQSACESQFD